MCSHDVICHYDLFGRLCLAVNMMFFDIMNFFQYKVVPKGCAAEAAHPIKEFLLQRQALICNTLAESVNAAKEIVVNMEKCILIFLYAVSIRQTLKECSHAIG